MELLHCYTTTEKEALETKLQIPYFLLYQQVTTLTLLLSLYFISITLLKLQIPYFLLYQQAVWKVDS